VDVAARVATTDDVGVAAGLLREAAAVLASERGGALFTGRELLGPPFEGQLAALLGDQSALVVIGTVEGVAMGLGLARLEELRGGGCVARFEFLWIEPGVRSVGLGDEIARLVESWAIERGAAGIDAYALPGNREAKSFLESSGYAARLIVMHRPLQASEPAPAGREPASHRDRGSP
jgi:hypothetical protein